LKKATGIVDSIVERQKKNLQKQEQTSQQLELQLEALRANDAPKFAIKIMEKIVALNASLTETEVKRLQDLEADNIKFTSEWKDFEEKLDNMDPLAIDDLVDQVATGEDASLRATSLVITAFLSATFLTWGSTFFGMNVSAILQEPAIPSVGDLTTWLMWTLPYVGATAAGAAIFGINFIGNRGTSRFLADDSFFGKIHPTTVLSLSSALAYSQAIAYQGVWLLFFLNLYRGEGNTFSLDPAAADQAAIQQAMGSLVAGPKLVGLIAGPVAVVSAAALETAYFTLKEWINQTVQGIFESDGKVIIDPENGFQIIQIRDSTDGDKEEGRSSFSTTAMVNAPPKLPSLAQLEMSTNEFLLTSARVFLASTWMSAETLVTGNLWMAVATGTVGIAVGMGAKRNAAREAGLADD
jgi:hypothetical protein